MESPGSDWNGVIRLGLAGVHRIGGVATGPAGIGPAGPATLRLECCGEIRQGRAGAMPLDAPDHFAGGGKMVVDARGRIG